MSRYPIVSTHHDAEGALSDDELDGVVGGNTAMCPLHPLEPLGHYVEDAMGILQKCGETTQSTRGPRLGG